MTARLEVLGDDGEWHEVPGVTSIRLDQEQPEPPPDDAYWRRHDALDALHFPDEVAKQRLNDALQRVATATAKAIKAELRRLTEKASKPSPSRILFDD
ncbi:hypothetical protein [Streptomyces sp. NPDC001076]